MSDLVEGTGLVGKDGKATGEMARWMKKSARDAAALGAGKAAKSQTWQQTFLIPFPENKDYPVEVGNVLPRDIETVTAKTATGSCTVTVKIGTTPLGGSSNSATSTASTQSHSSANAYGANASLNITISANSSAEDLTVTLSGTFSLA